MFVTILLAGDPSSVPRHLAILRPSSYTIVSRKRLASADLFRLWNNAPSLRIKSTNA
jgi:hypothetical protein